MKVLARIYAAPPDAPVALLPQLLDFDAGRIPVMDENGVDMHLLSQTAPGVQMFDADTGTPLAPLSNDVLPCTATTRTRFTACRPPTARS